MRADETSVVVVGGGLAGLATALHLAPMPVTLITGGPLGGESATRLAQGGIAAAIGRGDSAAQHAADTESAAAGLGDESVAGMVTGSAREAVAWLISRGVKFDRDEFDGFAFGLEAAHSHPRILHAGGDRTGREILRALVAAARAVPSVEVIECTEVVALIQNGNGVVDGVQFRRNNIATNLPARAVVLATGGIGGLYAYTTNPLTNVGSGLALGARAGAVLRDLEFVQFHPTAIDIGRDPMPLATEALRGAGAILVNAQGEDVMAGMPGGALAARDVVAATVFARCVQGEKVFLELPSGLVRELPMRFPGISALCAEVGLDLSRRRIPVRPAAHYHMGGLRVDARGRTSVEGLWACGEVASTGLHGGNRLASNSLLEAVVYATTIAEDLKGGISHLHVVRPTPLRQEGVASAAPAAPAVAAGRCAALRRLMDRHVGVVRDDDGLAEIGRTLASLVFGTGTPGSDVELAALLIALSALARRESRGAHQRADFPGADAAPRSQELTLELARVKALELIDSQTPLSKVAFQ